MEWWTWILLWLALAALALIFLGFLAWRIFRGFTGVMDELGRASELLSPDSVTHLESGSRPIPLAIFETPAAVRAENSRAARLRQWQRLERRVRRRSLRGQPQRLRDLPHL
ncbi:hypothetical protein [Arthrobacter sp.]|uniref:hypothetical protein n=1 Tax=Arthrobacter sp. TaxID=1667 RepID=UPI002810E2B3|nr:hypothetical protein [Arthrobacter sp.]